MMCSSVALLVRDDAVNDEGEIDTTGSAVVSRFSNPVAAGCVIVAISTAKAAGAAGCGAGVVASFPLFNRGATMTAGLISRGDSSRPQDSLDRGDSSRPQDSLDRGDSRRPQAFLAARRLSASEPPGD